MIGKLVFFRLKLILWKNCMIRRHHFILTLLEIGVPLALFMLLAYLRTTLSFMKIVYIDKPTYATLWSSEMLYSTFRPDYYIYYAPKTEFTSQLIKKVQSKLEIQDEKIEGLDSERDLMIHYETTGGSKSIRAVVFKNTNNHLKYILRPAEYKTEIEWYIEDLFSGSSTYEANTGSSSYLYTGLLALQMALDTSFIEIMSKRNLQVDLTMQEFPYPPHYDDGGRAELFQIGLPVVTTFGFLLLFPFVLQRVMDEKITGIKELMKMMGLKSWMLWLGWLLHALIVNVVSILLITVLMKAKVFGQELPVLVYCSASIFAVFLILYCISIVTFAFLISSFFSKPTLAVIVGIAVWLVCGNLGKKANSKLSTKILLGMLSPNKLLEYGYSQISMYETRQIGSNWTNLFVSGNNSSRNISLGLVFMLYIASSTLFMLITMYMEAVKPGPYGVAKPPHFPALYIWNKISRSNKVEDEESSTPENTARIEKPPKLNAGIVIKNLYKKFGTYTAVNNFSINIYEGQITALLGHNGAGKTTTMSIITGMISATSGRVIINNKDIKYHMDEVRGSLGFCPQSNLHFKDLNVNEHLIFFAMLKGSSCRRAQREAKQLLEKMNLTRKGSSAASTLSGGMQRKLSLGMALIGNSKVLILDEPTSGLDPEARREIWDILLTFRGSRIVIITTHFMEEADVLGDRIAIMDHGRLMCYGTSMYLKKEYGAGYNLTLVRNEEGYKAQKPNGPDQVEALTSIVRGKIRSAVLLSASGNRVIFLLPHDMKPYFGELLGVVEGKKEELFITNIALSVTTMEEVFLKVDSTVMEETRKDKSNGNDRGDDNISFVTNPTKKQTGQQLFKMQLCCLFKKRLLVLKRKWMLFVVAICIAIGATILTLYLGEKNSTSFNEGHHFDYNLNAYGKTTVYYGGHGSDSLLENIKRYYKQLVKSHSGTEEEVPNVSDQLIISGENNIAFYKDFLVVAAEFNVSKDGKIINAMFSNEAYHGAPISLNLVTNAVLKNAKGGDYSISASIAPLPRLAGSSIISLSSIGNAILWFTIFPLGLLFLTGTFLMFPHMERVSNVKQLQLMCGLRVIFYWMVSYLVDIILYLFAVAMIIISILLYGLVGSKTFSGVNEIGTLLFVLLSYGISVIPFAYLFTYKKTAASAFVWYFSASLFFAVVSVPLALLTKIKNALYFVFLIPYVGLTVFLVGFAYKASWNYNWKNYSPKYKELICNLDRSAPCCDYDYERCIESQFYLSTSNLINYRHVLVMASASILYFVILLLLESNFAQKLWEHFLVLVVEHLIPTRKKNQVIQEHDREDVLAEENRIADILKQEMNNLNEEEARVNEGELLLVHQIKKRFMLHQAVKGVSFAVKPGECFGLLGVNGAGKTTTFRILTGDLPLITGEARILMPDKERIYLSNKHKKYLKQVGYCPQFNALNEVLTARETLRLFAGLRGINEGYEEEINMWIKILGLEEYANKPCGVYSGGNKRKLSIAIALIGGLPVVMLDEPTSGVDPVSRRKLWDTLSALQKQEVKPSIILTSHSMEECEALCNNLVIMKAGQLECYGTIPNIKKKYAQGFTVMLKLRTVPLRYGKDKASGSNLPPSVASKSSGTIQSQGQSSVGSSKKSNISKNQEQSSSDQPKPAEDPIEVKNLMKEIESKYEGCCTLKDKHTGLLHYHINDKNKKWSQMFNEIEHLQQKHSIIEDYNISETTLEEVFLSIAREE